MPNWSSHLPRVGALVLSAAIAAAAYGVYTGQPSSSVKSTGESVADFLAADDDFDPNKAGERDYGFVRLQQLALEHLIG